MTHDKIKAAVRTRMMATGEPYSVARRQVMGEHSIGEHNIGQYSIGEHSVAQSTSAVSAEDLVAAAAVHRELGPEYSDAVVASFIDKVDREVAARVEARLADQARPRWAKRIRRGLPTARRRVTRDVLAASAGALVAVGAVGLYAITSTPPAPPAIWLAHGPCSGRPSTPECKVPTIRFHKITVKGSGGQITLFPDVQQGPVIPGAPVRQ